MNKENVLLYSTTRKIQRKLAAKAIQTNW